MASTSCTITGWRNRQSATWFPSSGLTSGITTATGASLYIASNPSGNNKYTIVVGIKTPNSSNIKSISQINVTFSMYKANNNAGTLYGSLRSTYTDLGSSDTASTYRTNAIGEEASATGYTTSYKSTTFSFSGTFAKNTTYYLVLYSKSNSDMYYTENGSKLAASATCEYTAPATYTVSYNANGGTGAPSSQTKTEDVTLTLSSTKPTRSSGSSSSTFTITGDGNGGYFGTTSTTTTSITATKTTPITYTFKNWNTAKAGTGTSYSAGGSYTANSGATLYAQWTETSGTPSYTNNAISGLTTPSRANTTVSDYKVTFNANGGSCSTASLQATKTRSYTFLGWNTSSSATTALANTTTYTSAKTVYAVWSPTDSGGSITLPTPTRTGYTFKGWSTSSSASSGTAAGSTYTPTSAVTLYATWQINTWAVGYNANGHGTAPSGQTKTYGQTLTLQPFIAQQTATGHTVSFNKNGGSSTPSNLTSTIYYDQTYWNTNAAGTGTNYSSGGSYTTDAATTLYAIWKTTNGSVTLPSGITRADTTETGYKVTFNANGGSCSTTELSATNTRSYTFSKWADGSTSGTKYAAGASYTPTAATTMYATWTESVTNGSITLPTPTRDGYTFKGWNTSSSASSGTAAGSTYTPTAATTLYAIWQVNTWTISYNANGHGTAPENQTKTYGQALTLRAFIAQQTGTGYTVSFNKNGGATTPSSITSNIYYNQSSWNTAANGSGTSYTSQGSYTANTGVTLYAIWEGSNGSITLPAAITRADSTETGFKVTFNANGGTCDTTELSATNTRKYTFKQWAASSTSGTGYNAGTSFTPTGATTMYATWNESVTKGSITLPVPTKKGYTFAGWATSASASSGATGTYTPSGNVTLYAIWTMDNSLVHYNNNGTDTLCSVYYNNNGTAVICNVYYNNNGTAVRI